MERLPKNALHSVYKKKNEVPPSPTTVIIIKYKFDITFSHTQTNVTFSFKQQKVKQQNKSTAGLLGMSVQNEHKYNYQTITL